MNDEDEFDITSTTVTSSTVITESWRHLCSNLRVCQLPSVEGWWVFPLRLLDSQPIRHTAMISLCQAKERLNSRSYESSRWSQGHDYFTSRL